MLVSQPQLTYMKGIQPVSLSERRWVHADEVAMRRGRQWRPCYLVLLSDLVLIAQRNRQVVFVTEPPLMLVDVIQHTFNVKKKETEFQLTVPAAGGGHRKPRCLAFRAPNLEAKLAWEDQVHKQMSLMRASQSSGSLASQRSVSCDALIETYKFEDLKPAEPHGAERGRRRSSSPPTSDRRLSTSSGSHVLPAPVKRQRPDTLRARLFGAPARPRPLNVKKLSASAKCCQYLSSLNVPAGERGRVTPVFEREGDMTIADFVKKRQKVLFDVQSADSADGAFETFLLDDELSSNSVTPPPPGSRHVSYGCVNVVRYRGAPPPPRRCRPQYNPYLDDRIEQDYPELVGAPVRRPSLTQGSTEDSGVAEDSGNGGAAQSKRGLLPSPSMKFADDDDLSPTGPGGLSLLRGTVESTGSKTNGQARLQEMNEEEMTNRVTTCNRVTEQATDHVVQGSKLRQIDRSYEQESRDQQSFECEKLSRTAKKCNGESESSVTTGKCERKTSVNEEETNRSGEHESESPVLELSLPASNGVLGAPLCYEICVNPENDGNDKTLAAIVHSKPPPSPVAGESSAVSPRELVSSDASCHSQPSSYARDAADRDVKESIDEDSRRVERLERNSSAEEHDDRRMSESRTSGSPRSQCSGFVDESPDAGEGCGEVSTDFAVLRASISPTRIPATLSLGDHGKPTARDGADDDRWTAETTILEPTVLRDDLTELEDSAYLSRSDELLERHSQKVLSTALSSSLSSLARRAGSIPSSLDRSEVRADPADPPLACRSEEVLPAFRCDDVDEQGASTTGVTGALLTRHGTSCDLVTDVSHGYVPCARRGATKALQRPYGQLVARQVAAFERQAGAAAPAAPVPRATSLGALWQVPPERGSADLSPATPSSRGSYLTSGSPATSASACDLDSTGEDATLAPSSGDSQNSLFGGLPDLEDEVAPDLTLELADGYRTQTDRLMPLSDIEEITEELDGFVSGSDILSPISEEASSSSAPQEPSPPERDSFLRPVPRKRQTQIKCDVNQQQDHQASEHMRNKVRMWANGIDVIPYSGPKTSRRHGEDGCYRTTEGVVANTGQPSVERALEVITDSFRGIGSEDQPDEEEADAAEIQVPDDLESPEDQTHESPVREEAPSHRTDKDSTKVTTITPHVAKSETTEHSQTNPTSSSTQDDLAGDGPRHGDEPFANGNGSSEKSGHETGEPEGETQQPAQRNQDAEAFDATKHQPTANDSLKDDGRGLIDAEVSREKALDAETLNTKEVATNDSSKANNIAGRETARESGEIALTDGPQSLEIASTKEVNVSSEDTRLMELPTKSSADSVDNQMSQPLPGSSPLSTQFEHPAPEQIPTDDEVHQTQNQRDSKEEQNVALLDNSPQTKERGDRVRHNNDEQEPRTTDDDELPSNESSQPIDEVGFALKPSEDPGVYLKTNGSMDEEVDAATRNVADVKADASLPEEVSRTSFAETVQGSLNCPKAADSAPQNPNDPADADRRFQSSNYHEELPADSEIETENEHPQTEDEHHGPDGDHIEADNLLTETEAGSASVEGRLRGVDCGPAATEGGSAGAESGPAESPRLVASIRSLLRHLSPVTERRRQEGDHRDTHDGHQAPTRAKRFPKFWSHHSRRDRKSEPISTHDSAHHGSHVSRSGKLTILTRQRPFTMATVSQMAAPEGHAAGRIAVLPSGAL
ncbi:uncharacterized protein LOC122391768 isoform X2 [Amphibalanus amphitrite]|uniref:uncharacterized protein LOC122391768 isoform X2 n=1 Tax=Amphibalanus amphitrite TaxID=1232801 RepID=UPI001C902944|nr:uncharacterized protein LOC122391768 isoform X2 [Amphibalanus amphitrite]